MSLPDTWSDWLGMATWACSMCGLETSRKASHPRALTDSSHLPSAGTTNGPSLKRMEPRSGNYPRSRRNANANIELSLCMSSNMCTSMKRVRSRQGRFELTWKVSQFSGKFLLLISQVEHHQAKQKYGILIPRSNWVALALEFCKYFFTLDFYALILVGRSIY